MPLDEAWPFVRAAASCVRSSAVAMPWRLWPGSTPTCVTALCGSRWPPGAVKVLA